MSEHLSWDTALSTLSFKRYFQCEKASASALRLSVDNTAFLRLGFQLVIIPEALENDPFRVCTARLSEASLKTSKQTIRKPSLRNKATQIRMSSEHATFPTEYKNMAS